MGRRAWFLLACAVLIPWQLWHVASHPQFARPPLPIGDGPDYETIGYSLSIGQGFAFAWDDPQWKAPYLADASAVQYPHLQWEDRAGPTTVRPPLIPVVIASIYRMLGRGPTAFAAFRCLSAFAIGLAGSLAVLIAFDVTRKMVSHQWIPHIASVVTLTLALFDSTLRTYAIDFLSEPLALLWTTIFLSLGLALEDLRLRRTKIFFLALMMATMIATRSIAIAWLPGIMLILLLLWKPTSSLNVATLVFFGLVVLLLSPWWIRNCQQLRIFMPMGAQGAASILGGYSDEALADHGNWHPEAELRLRQILKDSPTADKWSNLEFERSLAEAASIETGHWIHHHYRSLPNLFAMRLQTHWGPYFGKSLVWRCGMVLGVIALLSHRRRESYWMIGLPIVSSLTVMLLYETGGRFLVPLYGLLYALAGIGAAVTTAKLIKMLRRYA